MLIIVGRGSPDVNDTGVGMLREAARHGSALCSAFTSHFGFGTARAVAVAIARSLRSASSRRRCLRLASIRLMLRKFCNPA